MATYDHDYKFDIFISNAWLNGKPDPWVDAVQVALQTKLQEVGGKKPRLWRDQHQMTGGHLIQPAMLQGVADSALFLIVLSPAWLASKACKQELAQFRKRLPTGSKATEIPLLIVEKVPGGDLPSLLTKCVRRILHKRGSSGVSREFGLQTGPFKTEIGIVANAADRLLRTAKQPQVVPPNITKLVQSIRAATKDHITKTCGTMKVLTMEKPINWADVYTDVNIVERPHHLRNLSEKELLAAVDNQGRIGGLITKERKPGLQAVEENRHLLLLGKPGSGKTTFLKRVAFQSTEGHILPDQVPWFVHQPAYGTALSKAPGGHLPLQDFVQLKIKKFASAADTALLLPKGHLLLLLDSLDEVQTHATEVKKQIDTFVTDFPQCRVLITCRIAASEYRFRDFCDVEIADFTPEQVFAFSDKWFPARGRESRAGLFRTRLQENPPLLELASSPLLLTMLCLIFEDRDIEGDRAYIYNEGLEVLLSKWDKGRNLARDWPYQTLNTTQRRYLLSEIAYVGFHSGKLLFSEKQLTDQIAECFQNRPQWRSASDQEFDPLAVLKAIEAHHGLLVQRAQKVYSFSHLTFQEYLTAQRIRDRQSVLSKLLPRANDSRWREVFLLVAAMVAPEDFLPALKRHGDESVAGSEKIQRLLAWCDRKAAGESTNRREADRAFYFGLARGRTFALAFELGLHRTRIKDRTLNLAFNLGRTLDVDLSRTQDFRRILDLDLGLDLDLDLTLDLESFLALDLENALRTASRKGFTTLVSELRTLKQALPHPATPEWASSPKGTNWRKRLRATSLRHRDIGIDWNWTAHERRLLKNYNDANRTLVACIKAAPSLTATLREELLSSLLLPTKPN